MDTITNDLDTSILPDFGTSILPGFRFHPTDEELVDYYLKNRVEERDFPVHLIRVLELYRHDPWELPYLALRPIAEKEWFFFVPRDKKYPNAMRPNRVTVSGYWKATGIDKQIKQGNRLIGLKKTLVFYCGRAPSGEKTDWIMNEYRMPDATSQKNAQIMSLCKIYNKKHSKGLHSKHYVKKEESEPHDVIMQQYIRSVLQTQTSLSNSCCTSSSGSPAVSDQEVSTNESDFNYGPKEEEGRTRSYYKQHLFLDTAAAAASSAGWWKEDDLNYASLFMTPHCDGIIF